MNKNNKTMSLWALSALLIGILSGYYIGRANNTPIPIIDKNAKNVILTKDSIKLKNDIERVFTERVIWTRQHIFSTIEGNTEAQEASVKLLSNGEEIGDIFGKYYGDETKEKITKLFKEHTLTNNDIAKAYKIGDKIKINSAKERAKNNAADIADYLNEINSENWKKDEIEEMFINYLNLTNEQINMIIKRYWASDIKTFDKMLEEGIKISESVSNGIIIQFKDKFSPENEKNKK